MEDTDISAWLREWSATWKAADLPQHIRRTPGPRLRRSLGRCHPPSGRVRIHPALFSPEHVDLLREVVCHEAAHVAAYLIHGRGVKPHGREWQSLVAAAGYVPTARMNPQRLPRDLELTTRPSMIYRHRCPVCGATRVARRRVNRWRCRTCHDAGLGGKLEIVGLRQPSDV